MQNLKPRLLLAVALAIGVLILSAPNAWGQGNCVAFRGAVRASYQPIDPSNPSGEWAWIGDGEFTFGKGPVLKATIVDRNTGMKKAEGNTWIGTETATWTFNKDDSFQLITRFVTQHMNDPLGVYRVNETGTIANGTGTYKNVYGHFTVHGPFGPGVPGSTPPGTWNWTSEYHGNICGID